MKKQTLFMICIIILAVIISSYTALAGPAVKTGSDSYWRSATGNYFLPSGNIGIGTMNPTAKLQVENGNAVFLGNVGIGTTSPQHPLVVTKSTENYGTAAISGNIFADNTVFPVPSSVRASVAGAGTHNYQVDDVNWTAGIFGYVPPGGHDAMAGLFYVPVWDGVSWTNTARVVKIVNAYDHSLFVGVVNQSNMSDIERSDLLVTQAGNVGVGTNSPAYKFQVQGTSFFSGGMINVGNRGDGYAGIALQGAGMYNHIYVDASGRLYTHSQTSGDTLSVLQNGNVGIGKGDPSAKLDVNGLIYFKNAVMSSSEDLVLKVLASNVAYVSGGAPIFYYWNDGVGNDCNTKCSANGHTCSVAFAVHQGYISQPGCTYGNTPGIACICT